VRYVVDSKPFMCGSGIGNPVRGHFTGASLMIRSNKKWAGKGITPNKDGIIAPLESEFYLGRVLGKKETRHKDKPLHCYYN